MAQVPLDGSHQRIDIGSGVGITAPGLQGTAEFRDPAVGPSTTQERDFERSLANAGFTRRHSIVISQNTSPTHPVDLDLAPSAVGQRVVLLVRDESGVLSWHVGSPPLIASGAAVEPATAAVAGGTSLHFEIPVTRFGVGSMSPPTAAAAALAPQSVFGGSNLFHKVISVLEYPVATGIGWAAAQLYGRWEQSARPSMVSWFPPAGGLAKGVPLTDANWRTLAAGRSLLFIHGIFSNCVSGFNGIDEATTWPALRAAYGSRIFGFDHPTASVSPEDNVKAFLAQIPDGVQLDLDIVCHSRGGLVARILAGQLASLSVPNVRVGKIVFAGTPNGGTDITNPQQWNALVDRLTNLLSLLPPGPWTETTVVSEGVLELVKVIGDSGEKALAGLNAMEPGSPLYQALAAYAGATPDYFAIDAAFVPPPTLAHIFDIKDDASNAADAVVDIVFDHRPNDVAVPTIGVGDPGDAEVDPPPAQGTAPATAVAGFPVPDEHHLPFGPGLVWHCSYFHQPQTASKLVEWLTG